MRYATHSTARPARDGAVGDAVRAAQALEARTAIPMHYFTFDLGDDGQDEPVEVLRQELESAPGVRFAIPAPGETVEVP